jgi:hypothetical protein
VSEEERLIEEARESREETERVRAEGPHAASPDDGGAPGPEVDDSPPDEPWAKTSSGDADEAG